MAINVISDTTGQGIKGSLDELIQVIGDSKKAVVFGYYHEGSFYATRTGEGTDEDPYVYTDEIEGVTTSAYVDKGNSNAIYVFDGTNFTTPIPDVGTVEEVQDIMDSVFMEVVAPETGDNYIIPENAQYEGGLAIFNAPYEIERHTLMTQGEHEIYEVLESGTSGLTVGTSIDHNGVTVEPLFEDLRTRRIQNSN